MDFTVYFTKNRAKIQFFLDMCKFFCNFAAKI